MLNPVRATRADICDKSNFGKEEVFILAEVAAALRGLKTGKDAGEDEIRPKIWKALNEDRVCWLTSVFRVA